MATKPSKLPSPDRFPDAEPYWAAINEGRLLLKRCPRCSQAHYYPRPHCPFCGHRETEWITASGKASIYSFVPVRGAPRPTAVAIAELAEGPRLTTSIVNADVHALRIGDELVLTTLPGEGGQSVAAFTTPQANEARAYTARAIKALGTSPVEQGGAARSLQQAAVVGAGSMGAGIATALLNAGLTVCLIDRAPEVLEAARQTVHRNLDVLVQRGKLTQADGDARRQALRTSVDIQDVAGADVVIEAVWEQMELKKAIFALIDQHAPAHAVLGTNTSTLNIDHIADATGRPGQVVGLHFFSPAHVMPLLEVVRGPRTAPNVLAAARQLGAAMGKTAVVVGICDGFVGNRLMITRDHEADRLLLEGALPQHIDRVLTEFGLPMGTYEIADMAGGIELVHRIRQQKGQQGTIVSRLFEAGRLGQKTGKGYYRYEPGKRRPLPDPEVTALIEAASREAGIQRRAIGDEELRSRLILPMINEGAKLLDEGVVDRASDIDMVWQRGFGWPAWKGGPMYHADQLGLPLVVEQLTQLQQRLGERFRPSALLERMARAGERFTPTAG